MFKLYWSSAVICNITWNTLPFAFILMFPYFSYAVYHEGWKTFIVFYGSESVKKKIRFSFSSVSPINLFLIRNAVTAACNSSSGIDMTHSKAPVYFFLLQMIHSLNCCLLYFKNILHTQRCDFKNQKTNVTLLYLLMS